MAEKNTPIPFTVGDQENIVELKTILTTFVKGMDKKLEPLVSLPTRVSSLEETRGRKEVTNKRTIRAAVGLFIVVVGGLTLWGLKALLMASTGIPIP